MNILYVEDDEHLREEIALLAGGPGRDIVTCGSAEHARSLLTTQDFDVVITDIGLPGANGIELTHELVRANASQWVIVCTGYELQGGLAELGANVRALVKDEVDSLLPPLLEAIARELAHRAA